MTVKAISFDPVDIYRAPSYGRAGEQFRAYNLDTENTIYYSDSITVDANSNQLPPLGSATFDGKHDVWMSTLDPGTTVAIQTGIRGERTWTAGIVPPQVPNIASAAAIDIGTSSSPNQVFQFTGRGRLWGVNLAGDVISTSGVTAATRAFVLAQLDGNGIVGQGTPLAILEMGAFPAPGDDSESIYVPFNGLPVKNAQALYLIVNGGNPITGATLGGSAIFFYSIP